MTKIPPYVSLKKNPSGTSRDAAISMMTTAPNLRGRIYRYIDASPNGRTCDEAEIHFGIHQTVSPRIKELKDAKLIEQRGKRPTRSGRPADVHYSVSVEPQGELF